MTPDTMLVVLAMRGLAHTADTDALAEALVAEARTWDEVTWAIGIAYREGSNRLNIVGDQGRARCTYQLHRAPREVLTNARLCTRIALERLRASARLCPSAPLAAYAGRPCGSEGAGLVSRDRWRIGLAALRKVGGT